MLSGGSFALESLEATTFHQDLNGDGTTGLVTTVIESFGTTLTKVADSYFMNYGSSGPQVRYAGAYVAAGQFGAWTPLGAQPSGGGYQVVWKNGSADQYTTWTTDGSGNWLSSGAVLSGASFALESLETTFGQDLNGDGTGGVATTNVKSADATTLAKVADTFSLYGHGTTTGPQLKFSGAAVTVGQFGAWTPLGAEPGAGGYQVIWKNGSADQYIVWTTNSSGNWLSQGAVLSGTSFALESLETTFGQDLNGDGTVGVVTTNVETVGATTLAKVVNTYSLYGHGTTTGPQLKFSGAAVTVGQFGAWTPLGAEPGAGGYQVAWKNGSADQYIVWTTDTNGNWLSQGAVLSAASFALQSLETTFSQNLNGDGTLGPITTPIETVGPTTLTKVADSYFMNYGSSGPQLRYAGAYVAAGQFGAWAPIAAEQTAGGYQVAWQFGTTDQYVVWNTDSSGNYLSQSAVVSGSSATLRAFENTFHQDLNSNGVIGATAPMMSSSKSAAEIGPVSSGTLNWRF